MDRIAFRELPGIAELEEQTRLFNDNRLDKDECHALFARMDEKSLELFGILEPDTYYNDLPHEARPEKPDDWETHFAFLEWEYEEEGAFWNAFGVDVTDGEGSELACLPFFGRQLVCGLKQIHPRAAINFGGRALSDEHLASAAEAWGRRLLGR